MIAEYLRYILGRGSLLVSPICEQHGKKRPVVNKVKIIKFFKHHFLKSHDYGKAMIKFRSKFQFQILLQFNRTAEKVIKVKHVMVIVESFDKYHHLFNLYILITICFSIIEIQEYKGSLTQRIKFSPKRIQCRNNCMEYKTILCFSF